MGICCAVVTKGILRTQLRDRNYRHVQTKAMHINGSPIRENYLLEVGQGGGRRYNHIGCREGIQGYRRDQGVVQDEAAECGVRGILVLRFARVIMTVSHDSSVHLLQKHGLGRNKKRENESRKRKREYIWTESVKVAKTMLPICEPGQGLTIKRVEKEKTFPECVGVSRT